MAVTQLGDFLKQRGHSLDVAEITTDDIRGFIGHMLATRSPATANQRYRSINVLFKWLADEGEIESNPMVRVSRPKAVPPLIEVITERNLRLLLDTCDSGFLGRRDSAIISILWDTGLRVSELTGLRVEDVSLDLEICWVDGKSGPRQAPFTMTTTRAVDRYLRLRNRHRNGHRSALWLSDRGRGSELTKSGVGRMLARRSEIAGIPRINPHMFRHSCADRLLSAGLSEGSLMEIMGWSDRTMLDRYGRSARGRRAFDDYRRLIG